MSKTVIANGLLGDSHTIDVSQLQWRPSVYAIVIVDGKILLSPRFKQGYDLPGGGVDLGEDLENALIREVKEETGIDVAVNKLVALRTNFFASTHDEGVDDEYYQSVMAYYTCEVVGGALSTEGLDELEKQFVELAKWIPVEEIDNIKPMNTVDFRGIVKECLIESKL